MATVTTIIHTCDECGTEDNVTEKTVAIDKLAPVVIDACESCWETSFEPLSRLLKKGRTAKVAARQRRAVGRSAGPVRAKAS